MGQSHIHFPPKKIEQLEFQRLEKENAKTETEKLRLQLQAECELNFENELVESGEFDEDLDF